MWEILSDGFAYLGAQSWQSFIALFWFVILFEVPRYTIVYISAGLLLPFHRRIPAGGKHPRITAVIAGHNEADVIERCIMAIFFFLSSSTSFLHSCLRLPMN